MLLKYFYDKSLAHASYMVGCQQSGDAIVVDPCRDIEPYLAAAAAEGDDDGAEVRGQPGERDDAEGLTASRGPGSLQRRAEHRGGPACPVERGAANSAARVPSSHGGSHWFESSAAHSA